MANVAAHKMRTTIVLPLVLKARVEQHSEKTGAPMGEIIRRALAAYLESKEMEAA
jgi:predicted DNA-binding protein